MRALARALATVALLLLARSGASAHPIAQGSLEVDVAPGAVRVRARVPLEEVFVAGALGRKGPNTATLADAYSAHGDYIGRHLRVEADGNTLTPKVAAIVPPKDGRDSFITYELAYRTPSPPNRIRLTEDLLREIEYAPGNPWEVTYIVRVSESGTTAHDGLLLSAAHPLDVACGGSSVNASLDRPRLFGEYLGHGIRHILGGYDHLLFIAALVLAARSFWDVVKVVSAFTVAHSVTLALSVLDVVRLPSRIVEPMIAASIVVVAVTNVLWPERRRGIAWLATAFFFGLFHGLGFAGGLLDAMGGLPGASVGLAIVAFSAGVELGHQMVVLPLYASLRAARATRRTEAARDRLALAMIRGGSMAISVAGLVYLVAALRYAGGT